MIALEEEGVLLSELEIEIEIELLGDEGTDVEDIASVELEPETSDEEVELELAG